MSQWGMAPLDAHFYIDYFAAAGKNIVIGPRSASPRRMPDRFGAALCGN
jgi:hypothetical protein